MTTHTISDSETSPLLQSLPDSNFSASKRVDLEDADEALQAFGESVGDPIIIDEETDRRLRRKIDLNLLPLMCVVWGLYYLDKAAVSYTSVMGLEEDLHLTPKNFQWLGSLFYIGYLLFQYPTNHLLQRLPLAKYIAINVYMWGFTMIGMSLITTFVGIATVRFFLGVFEAVVTPGFALITSQWYTKGEQGMRTGIWYGANGFASIIGSCVALGIFRETKNTPIPAWRLIFLFWGVVTLLTASAFLFRIPDSPLKASWLSKEERRQAIERIRNNQQGIGNTKFKLYQFKEAMLDVQTWAAVIFALGYSIPSGGISIFSNKLILSFGYTPEQVNLLFGFNSSSAEDDQALLFDAPGNLLTSIIVIFFGYLGSRFRQRALISASGLPIAMLGMYLIASLPTENKGGQLLGYFGLIFVPPTYVTWISFLASNVAGYTKKTTTWAVFMIAFSLGSILGPHIFNRDSSGRYSQTGQIILLSWGICFLDLLFIRMYYRLRNRANAKIRKALGYIKTPNGEWLDLTDKENPEFVYML